MCAELSVPHGPRPAAPVFQCIAVVLTLGLLAACGGPEEPVAPSTAPAERRAIERVVVATGTIEPEGEVAVRPRIAGIVESIAVARGDQVKVGDPLVEIERELIENQVSEAEASVRVAEVELRFARIAVDRANQLQARGASSDQALDEARAAHEGAVARLARARAALSALSVQLQYATVRSPINGRVLDVPVKIGAAVSPVTSVTGGTIMLVLAETERLHMKGSVDENEIARIEVGQPARVRTEAYRGRGFDGVVRDIAPMGERIQNVTYFEVEVEITDPDAHLLRPRMSSDAEIIAEKIDDALVVPETALRYVGESIYVEVVAGSPETPGRGERRDVAVGVVDGNLVQILDGLDAGEEVSLQ